MFWFRFVLSIQFFDSHSICTLSNDLLKQGNHIANARVIHLFFFVVASIAYVALFDCKNGMKVDIVFLLLRAPDNLPAVSSWAFKVPLSTLLEMVLYLVEGQVHFAALIYAREGCISQKTLNGFACIFEVTAKRVLARPALSLVFVATSAAKARLANLLTTVRTIFGLDW